jgi:lysine-N-methylase
MTFPIHHLPVLQNWDCHVCGTCCKEYRVTVSDEERRRIEAQGWDKDADLGGLPPFKKFGKPWARQYQLNHRPDGSCVFLSEQGRCRIHERFGYETKPLPCRLFPFVLVPAGREWRVGVRYACPSAAANKGRGVTEHDPDLAEFALLLARREGLKPQPDGTLTRPPPLDSAHRLDWPDLLRVVDALLELLHNRREPLERRWRKCLALARAMRKARLDGITGGNLTELLKLMQGVADGETPANLMMLPAPSWVGRVLFRQAVALYTRKDHGPNQGLPGRGRVVLFRSALRFARGRGAVPRMHAWLPETTFAEVEKPGGPLLLAAEAVLERYYTTKVGSVQFCGPVAFNMMFWEGLEALALTYPVLLWVARMFRGTCPAEEAVTKALSIVDDHFGFNRVLGTLRQRLGFQILARTGELARLIAWYSR